MSSTFSKISQSLWLPLLYATLWLPFGEKNCHGRFVHLDFLTYKIKKKKTWNFDEETTMADKFSILSWFWTSQTWTYMSWFRKSWGGSGSNWIPSSAYRSSLKFINKATTLTGKKKQLGNYLSNTNLISKHEYFRHHHGFLKKRPVTESVTSYRYEEFYSI